jgi:uncharacterized protein (DUF2164 family)
MAIVLDEQTEQYLLGSIRRFFAEELDDDIGDLKARSVLDFFVREVGPSVYNQALADAQTTMTVAVADLAGNRYEPEFNYWKRS